MSFYGSADLTREGTLPSVGFAHDTQITNFTTGASGATHTIMRMSKYWWGSGAVLLECWNVYYDGRSAGYAQYSPRGVTNNAIGQMNIHTHFNQNCPGPSWGGFIGTAPGRACDLSYNAGTYSNYVWKLTAVNMAFVSSAAACDNNNSVFLYGGTRIWG